MFVFVIMIISFVEDILGHMANIFLFLFSAAHCSFNVIVL